MINRTKEVWDVCGLPVVLNVYGSGLHVMKLLVQQGYHSRLYESEFEFVEQL